MIDFTQVVAVRNRKLGRARNAERQSMHACDAARETVENARQAMRDYSDEIRTLEVDLISRLVDTRITLQDVNNLNIELERAKKKATKLADEHKEANGRLDEAEKQVENLRRERVEKEVKLNKITELNERILEQEATSSINAQDAALDEFLDTMNARRTQ